MGVRREEGGINQFTRRFHTSAKARYEVIPRFETSQMASIALDESSEHARIAEKPS